MNIVILLRTARHRHIAVSALKVAMVVGTLLNLVNQGGRLLDGMTINTLQMLLNYLVPFCVSSYSAARNEMQRCAE